MNNRLDVGETITYVHYVVHFLCTRLNGNSLTFSFTLGLLWTFYSDQTKIFPLATWVPQDFTWNSIIPRSQYLSITNLVIYPGPCNFTLWLYPFRWPIGGTIQLDHTSCYIFIYFDMLHVICYTSSSVLKMIEST